MLSYKVPPSWMPTLPKACLSLASCPLRGFQQERNLSFPWKKNIPSFSLGLPITSAENFKMPTGVPVSISHFGTAHIGRRPRESLTLWPGCCSNRPILLLRNWNNLRKRRKKILMVCSAFRAVFLELGANSKKKKKEEEEEGYKCPDEINKYFLPIPHLLPPQGFPHSEVSVLLFWYQFFSRIFCCVGLVFLFNHVTLSILAYHHPAWLSHQRGSLEHLQEPHLQETCWEHK